MGCLNSKQNRIVMKQAISFGGIIVNKDLLIGDGGYAQIWKCKNISSRTIYALKQIKLQTEQLRTMYERQTQIMSKLKDCTNVIKIIAHKKIQNKQSYQLGYILMEFGQKTLMDQLKNRKLSDQQILNAIKQIANGLKQMHKNQIFHLDLKPENIIITSDMTYKICDFGSAISKAIDLKSLSKRQKNQLVDYIESNSTLIYRAPQMIDLDLGGKRIDQTSDIWMLGCIVYFLTYRKHPFVDGGKLSIISNNVQYENCNPKLRKIIEKCLITNQQQRGELDDIIKLIQ